ncbi:helix-turn-helix transcriptional regulator [Flavobacterium cucumis]|uniref:Helix-turn-helix n=1 Tax=Flavobacterium cucumis TaxID=416016 RepID=A0A1M7ZZ70_9FLAO|nr:helix-turn-helix transcriptional regulator [Flavobacterium cucumis]SHO74165.1 Helix-turn-helix [Flavobacterium cucumis]
MLNIDDFIKRLEIILDYYGLSASGFADKIGVQRSSLSHLLSGRNKPSLDFVLKVVEVFPEVDLYWILNGAGSFPKSELSDQNVSAPSKKTSSSAAAEIPSAEPDLFSSTTKEAQSLFSEQDDLNSFQPPLENAEEIERIVIFFKNGTFKNYKA